jgi:hypothetical protein
MKRILLFIALLVCASCSGNNENAHTTATTVVPPPPRQVLRAEFRKIAPATFNSDVSLIQGHGFDRTKPILFWLNLQNDVTYREGEPVVIAFMLVNAQLKGDGGEYRVRYMVDDDDMQWIDRMEEVWLWGWLPGKHTIRLELIGPDGWPARNGQLNIETREITIVK